MKANLTLFFLLVFVVGAVIGWDWPNIAKIMPVYVAAIPGIILVLVQLYREVTGWQGRRGTAGCRWLAGRHRIAPPPDADLG